MKVLLLTNNQAQQLLQWIPLSQEWEGLEVMQLYKPLSVADFSGLSLAYMYRATAC